MLTNLTKGHAQGLGQGGKGVGRKSYVRTICRVAEEKEFLGGLEFTLLRVIFNFSCISNMALTVLPRNECYALLTKRCVTNTKD